MKYRFAVVEDIPLLARMNRQLAEDEGHRNRFHADSWFENRMRDFINGNYRAILFEREERIVAYALFTDQTENSDTVYLRQIFVDRSCRRQGIGRDAMRILQEEIWPAEKRITVGVLYGNQTAIDFYRAIGFQPYSIEMELPPARTAEPGRAALALAKRGKRGPA
jgi:ribosomal protein S18 acetylase RimI-like enzyme